MLVSTRTIHGRTCQLSGAQQKHLLSLLSTLRLVDATPAPPARGTEGTVDGSAPGGDDETPTDPLVIDIPAHKLRPLDRSDPALGGVAGLAGPLVADVTLPSPAATEYPPVNGCLRKLR